MTSNVIGINGIKRSGKDTVGQIIGEYCDKRLIPFQHLAFANEIRNLTLESLPGPMIGIITMDDLKGEGHIDRDNEDIFKLTGIPDGQQTDYVIQWINDFIDLVKSKHGYELTGFLSEIPTINTIRDALVIFGTEIGRDLFFHDIWIDIVRTQITEFDGISVVTDVRFDNEAEAVRALSGKVLRIVKPDLVNSSNHRSEMGISDLLVDNEIVNIQGDLDGLKKNTEDYLRHEYDV